MSKQGEIVRGDTQTISIPVSPFFSTVIGGTAALFIVPTTSTPPDIFLDPTALITKQLGPFVTEVDTFDFVLTNSDTLIALDTYNWYARFQNAGGGFTSIQLNPSCVEVIPPKGDGC